MQRRAPLLQLRHCQEVGGQVQPRDVCLGPGAAVPAAADAGAAANVQDAGRRRKPVAGVVRLQQHRCNNQSQSCVTMAAE
jgi:hypothetical protein